MARVSLMGKETLHARKEAIETTTPLARFARTQLLRRYCRYCRVTTGCTSEMHCCYCESWKYNREKFTVILVNGPRVTYNFDWFAQIRSSKTFLTRYLLLSRCFDVSHDTSRRITQNRGYYNTLIAHRKSGFLRDPNLSFTTMWRTCAI